MAGYYRVELDALGRMSTQLGSCADDMRSAMKLLKDIGPQGSGDVELEKACDDFRKAWGYGIGLIADATGGITEGLSATHKVYATLEQRIADSFHASGKGGDA